MQQQQAEAPLCSEAVRKMAQPRRGSSSAGGGAPPAEEAPGPPLPPQSLALQQAGLPPQAQKKKSGFQITSVTPAAASLSSNNSIAEDTESYEDLDESLHTEDLSSSELLDVSLSRATDLGGPERSSSEETLSNLQEAESPGALSPNQPRPPPTVNGGLHHPPPAHSQARAAEPAACGTPGPQHCSTPAGPPWTQPSSTAGPPWTQPSSTAGAPWTQPPGTAWTQPSSTAGASSTSWTHPSSAAGPQLAPSMANVNMMNNLPGLPAQPPGSNGAPAPQAGPAAPQPASRFRVVKLDSSSEPFRKGRWTCSEFYEREEVALHRALEGVRHGPAEAASEQRDSTSGSSVSSSLSTLSHYTESVGSGEVLQQPEHPQEAGYGQQKLAFQPLPVSMVTLPHQQPATAALAYSQQPPTVPQPQLHYAPQQHGAATQMASAHAIPVSQSSANVSEYLQHPQVPTVQSSAAGPPPGTQAQPLQAQMPSTSVQAQSSMAASLPTAHPQTSVPAAGGQVVGVGQHGSLPTAAHQSHSLNQGISSVLQQNVTTQSTQILQPPHATIIQQGVHIGASGLPQQVVIATQNPPLAAKPQAQGMEPVLQGMTNPQIPAVSPIPPTATVAAMNQLSLTASASLGSAPIMSQPSTVHTGNVGQSVSQLPASLPIAQHMAHQIPLSSAQFFGPSLIQSVANQIADARRLMEHSVAGLPQTITAEGLSGIGVSSTLDGSGNTLTGPGQLLPLKTTLVDGEDESSAGANVVAIDNKIEQAMDLVKSHLMYAVREEVEVLKEQIKELIEKNSQLEQENSLLKTLASPEQMAQFQAQLQTGSPPASSQPPAPPASGPPGTV